MEAERRKNDALRRVVVLGNCLSLWAGREAKTQGEKDELARLFEAWEHALTALREEKRNTLLRIV